MKSGGLYEFVTYAKIEADLAPAVVYRSLEDGWVWVRPRAEFHDGRFVQVSPSPTQINIIASDAHGKLYVLTATTDEGWIPMELDQEQHPPVRFVRLEVNDDRRLMSYPFPED